MTEMITEDGLNLLFRGARTYTTWSEQPVAEATLRQLWDLTRMGPTSMNCLPARVVFVQSDAAKAKLKPCLAQGNVDKTMAAPVCAILALDSEFHQRMPYLFPHMDAKSMFEGNAALAADTMIRNGNLQGGYFIMAARALGLDCGPMSGFDRESVDAAFFAGSSWRSNFLCNLGYGTDEGLHPRGPRLDFDEACRIA